MFRHVKCVCVVVVYVLFVMAVMYAFTRRHQRQLEHFLTDVGVVMHGLVTSVVQWWMLMGRFENDAQNHTFRKK